MLNNAATFEDCGGWRERNPNVGSTNAHITSDRTLGQLGSAAIELAELGYHVSPLRLSDKSPATENGHLDASCDPQVVTGMWQRSDATARTAVTLMPRCDKRDGADREWSDWLLRGESSRRQNTTAPADSIVGGISDYHTIRTSAYENVLNENLDVLARDALRFAFQAGQLADDPDIPAEHREAMKAIADGVGSRLLERCMAYETVLRTTPVPDTEGPTQTARGRRPKRRAVRDA